MLAHLQRKTSLTLTAYALVVAAAVMSFLVSKPVWAQDTPLISGGVAFFSSTTGGQTGYLAPLAEPLAVLPLGQRFMIQSRAGIVESVFANGAGVYTPRFSATLVYLEGDYIASPHLTIAAGSFLTPFGTYNERLSPLWINNMQDGPVISGLGTMGTGTSNGVMLRGSAVSNKKVSISYATYFSARDNNKEFKAQRSAGGRLSVYFPEARLEIGASYGRLLQGTQENFYGTHVWWEPKGTAFRLRSEYASGAHAHGYWVEADYRTRAFGGLNSWVGRFEPVARLQQTFRHDTIASDGLPIANSQRADFGLDYNLPNNLRLLTSYSRQFQPNGGNKNIWETGITYRFLFPAWKGKK